MPACTLLVSVPGRLAALTILWKCHDFGLFWWIGVPAVLVVVVVGILFDPSSGSSHHHGVKCGNKHYNGSLRHP
jgi:hypothetical protein